MNVALSPFIVACTLHTPL